MSHLGEGREAHQPVRGGTRSQCGEKRCLLFCPGRRPSLADPGSQNPPGRELHQSETVCETPWGRGHRGPVILIFQSSCAEGQIPGL